jgi:hypothetical protein
MMRTLRVAVATILLVVGLAILLPFTGTHAEPPVPAVSSPKRVAAETCAQILTRAFQTLQSTCNEVSRNSACYGNNQVKAEPKVGAALKFATAGDRAPIRSIRTLNTSPLDVNAGTWGLSLLKLQANLPDTLPGQNVTFLVFGDTTVENASGDMQSFYFTSGLGNLECKEAPRDGIVVRSPQHTEVSFTANGVKITIASTIVLRAERHKSMSVALVEGMARLTTPRGSQTLKPGEVSTVTLGGTNGLTATDAPSAPTAAVGDAALASALVTTGQVDDPNAPIRVAIEGCITAVQGNTITVNDYAIPIGQDKILKDAKVGDCVHVDGTLHINADHKITLSVVKAQASTSANTGKDASQSKRDQDKAKGTASPSQPGQGNDGSSSGNGSGNGGGNGSSGNGNSGSGVSNGGGNSSNGNAGSNGNGGNGNSGSGVSSNGGHGNSGNSGNGGYGGGNGGGPG